jgi:murein L,D-transpeptidase YcbB/YkuD
MIKNYNFNIAEEEKRQILSLHESRTKRHYLINEQSDVYNPTIEQAKQFVDKYNAYIAKNPNAAVLKDAKYMNNVQIAMNKINGGQNPDKPVQSQQTQSNNNSFSNYVKQAQTALGVTADGKFGPKTLEALMAKVKPTAVPAVPAVQTAAVTAPPTSENTPETQNLQNSGINPPNKSGIVIPPKEVKQPQPLGSGGFKGMPKPTKF